MTSLTVLAAAEGGRGVSSPQASRGVSPVLLADENSDGVADRTGRDSATRRDAASSPASNPLVPFLDRWLSTRHALPRMEATSRPLVAPESEAAVRRAPLELPALAQSPAESTRNPYIEAMAGQRAASESVAKSPAGVTPKPTLPPARPPPVSDESRVVAPTLIAPEPPARTGDPTYRPPPSRDTKYFPQQKRF